MLFNPDSSKQAQQVVFPCKKDPNHNDIYFNNVPLNRNLDSRETFRKKLSKYIRPSEKSIFNIYDPQRSKLLNRLRLGFSHLREH